MAFVRRQLLRPLTIQQAEQFEVQILGGCLLLSCGLRRMLTTQEPCDILSALEIETKRYLLGT